MSRPARRVRLGPREVVAERRADGALVLRSPHPLGDYPRRMTDRVDHWAARAPDRVLFAQRSGAGWRTLTYAGAAQQGRRVAQALLDRALSAERPVALLSGNDIEHGLLHLGALYAGIPYAPVSPAYSLLSQDYARLRDVLELLTPGLVCVFSRDPRFEKAVAAAVPRGVEVVHELPLAEPRDVEDAHARVGPDTIVKFLFTSGSTGTPKAVINTQRMWCANQAMIAAMFEFFRDEPPVILDWAPWHHTAAGNHNIGIALYSGGSIYIDEGKPLPGLIETTVANLREVAPNWYFNVPRGFEALLPYLQADEALRRNFFSRLKVLWFAGAAMPQHVFDAYKDLAYATCGETVPFLTGLGATETSPYAMGRMWETQDSTNMGLPPPGGEIKLVPFGDDKYEARIKGAHVTPGYWRRPQLTAQAFDEEGWYQLGDLLSFDRVEDGLLFRGRLTEDFKLATGTWVNVGPLRAKLVQHFAPMVRDVVIAGEGRDEIAALIFPAAEFSREQFEQKKATLHGTGSSNRIARFLILEEPPSLDAGEMTDKGSINQKAVLKRRAHLVDELYG